MDNMDIVKEGGGLQCSDCKKVEISNSYFSNLKSEFGGGLYFTYSTSNKIGANLVISNTVITNCQAHIGGGLYINNPNLVTISNTTFKDNLAYISNLTNEGGKAGGLYYECSQFM